MSADSEQFLAQATRSFGDYLQGATYVLDPRDQQLMALVGAGYFSREVNPHLTRTQFTYEAGEVVEVDGPVGAEQDADSEDRQRPRARPRVKGRARNNESGEGVRAPEDGSAG